MTRPATILPLLCLLGTATAQHSAPMPPEETQSEKVRFCGGIVNPPCTTPPRLIYSPDPEYPKHNGKVRLPGTVELTLVVGPDGLTRDITVFRSLRDRKS